MNSTFGELLNNLIKDEAIVEQAKLAILAEWKEKMIANNANKLMDKKSAEHHFDWLRKIDNAIKEIAP